MSESRLTREMIIDAAKQAAKDLGTSILARSDFERQTGISEYHIYRLFPDGGWSEIRSLAGLDRHPHDNGARSDDELLTEFHRVTSTLGKIPSWHLFASRASVSPDTVRKRFGGLQGTLARYREWLVKHEPNSPLLSDLTNGLKGEAASPPTRPAAQFTPALWPRRATVEYGQPISFRGLRHAPINEQGVVYLFGMVSYELGFLVETIHTAYPDCEAKRCVDRRNDRWQRVRIEFEYRSSNFRDHGHDYALCDAIVCWEHDWPACPIEVIELRHVILDLET